ncbi:MAG TPA: ribonuclease R [Rhodocyclaceae bacterium]|nr:ribonuclease R [Rhodocyclaceae bacterium]
MSQEKKNISPKTSSKKPRAARVSSVRLADPFYEREKDKYENPLPSREYVLQILTDTARPMSGEELIAQLDIKPEEVDHFARRIFAMEREGQLMRNRAGDYIIPDKADLVKGRVEGHPDGFGFLVPDDGSDDMFLGPRAMREVMHGDKILVRAMGVDQRGRREAKVIEILERANTQVIGRVMVEQGVVFIQAENRRISNQILLAPDTTRTPPAAGQIVTVMITQQPSANTQAIGRIVQTLGNYADPGMEIEIALRKHDLPFEFSAEGQAEAKKLPDVVRKKDWTPGREDIRHLPLVTIDGETARDFDDAVYCEKQGKGYRLLVAIADVSHYVTPGFALDADALTRGTSVYFPRRVIPMLPEKLSNGLCSLNPQVERLCMVCDMDINPMGVIKKYRFYPAVMYSHARLTYNKVAAALYEKDTALRNELVDLLPHLGHLDELFRVLLKARAKRGAIDFETVETKMVFDENGKIERIVPEHRNDAHRLIEECMLAANVCASNYLQESGQESLYRIHEGPTEEKLGRLREFLGEFGITLAGGEKPRAGDFAKVVAQIKERPDAQLIQTVMLRSLQQAVYSPDNVGHFGLAYDAYTHFTSPIRRYPDLLVHRAIKAVLAKKPYQPSAGPVELLMDTRRKRTKSKSGRDGKPARGKNQRDEIATPPVPEKAKKTGIWEEIGVHCSQTERRADEASRDVETWLKCFYMQDRIGETYEGSITAVTSFGIFVTLDDLFVEGLVHISELGKDYFHHDEARHELLGERTGQRYRLSDRVGVQVVRVDLETRKIDFRLLEAEERATTRTGKTERDRAKANTKVAAPVIEKMPAPIAAKQKQTPVREHAKPKRLLPQPVSDEVARPSRSAATTPARPAILDDDDDGVVSWRKLAGLPDRKGPHAIAVEVVGKREPRGGATGAKGRAPVSGRSSSADSRPVGKTAVNKSVPKPKAKTKVKPKTPAKAQPKVTPAAPRKASTVKPTARKPVASKGGRHGG